MDTQRGFLDFHQPMDHQLMMEYLNVMSERYPFLGITSLGESMMGRMLPIASIGTGEKAVLYVGGHAGNEWGTASFLLRFLNEICELYQSGGKAFRYAIPYLLDSRTLYLIPMLNPDGIEYHLHGVSSENILYERLCGMNGSCRDFSNWQANARGVDLRHNYAHGFAEYRAAAARQGVVGGAPSGYGGEMPESEPEVGQLCNFLRYHEEIRSVMSLYLSGERVEYGSAQKPLPRARAMAETLSRLGGYRLLEEACETRADLGEMCIGEWKLPTFSVYCGKKDHLASLGDWFFVYTGIREMLFTLPALV